jgi:hypothetical protein
MNSGPFQLFAGRKYRVLKPFVAGSKFVMGEILTYVRCQGYSRYDDVFVYEFRTLDGEEKTWFAPADMASASVTDFIVLV